MLSLLSAAASSSEPIYWVDLGLKNYLFRIGSFELRWYSLAYIAGIILAYWCAIRMIKMPGAPMAQRHCDDLFFYCTLGVIVGGRLGYVTFYDPEIWQNPLDVLKLWNGGMSFHGGLAGATLAIAWVSWRGQLNFLRVSDYVAVGVPFGMLFGRLANFVNGELWGRVAQDVPWAMVFPGAGPFPRHPSQLYEAALEGAVMILVMQLLFWKTNARYRPGLLMGAFGTGLGLSRFIVEFFREPDVQLQAFAARSGLSMGQWLTLPVIAIGLFFIIRALMRPQLGSTAAVPQ